MQVLAYDKNKCSDDEDVDDADDADDDDVRAKKDIFEKELKKGDQPGWEEF